MHTEKVMDPTLKKSNLIALQYCTKMSSIVSDICSPFLKNHNITGFTYIRMFNNGSRLYVTNLKEWVRHYISNDLYNDIQHMEYYIPPSDAQYSLWSGFKKDRVFDALYHIDLWHGFTVYERHNDYIDSYDFCTKRENENIKNFYLNNLPLLHDLIHHFKKRTSKVIDFSDQKKLIVPDLIFDISKVKHTSYVSSTQVSNFNDFIGDIGLNIT